MEDVGEAMLQPTVFCMSRVVGELLWESGRDQLRSLRESPLVARLDAIHRDREIANAGAYRVAHERDRDVDASCVNDLIDRIFDELCLRHE